ncbi:uncharacterized [Tachysurus ichikawai]
MHSYSCHTFAPVSLLYSHNVTFPHHTKSTAAGSNQIKFPSRSVEGQELLFLITNASGDVVTYQLKEQLGHQVAQMFIFSSPAALYLPNNKALFEGQIELQLML